MKKVIPEGIEDGKFMKIPKNLQKNGETRLKNANVHPVFFLFQDDYTDIYTYMQVHIYVYLYILHYMNLNL